MKKNLLLLSTLVFLVLSCCHVQKPNQSLQEFTEKFPTANVQLRGHLILFGDYKGDLSKLTYDNYISLLKQNEQPSTKGVEEIVEHADQHYFKAEKNTFLIVIYSKMLNAVIFDNATTTFCDSIKVFKTNEPVPALSGFIREPK